MLDFATPSGGVLRLHGSSYSFMFQDVEKLDSMLEHRPMEGLTRPKKQTKSLSPNPYDLRPASFVDVPKIFRSIQVFRCW